MSRPRGQPPSFITMTSIVLVLETIRQHVTGRLWVDGLIKPVFIADLLIRADREGYFLPQQLCLKEMLPYFFAAGYSQNVAYVALYIQNMKYLPSETKCLDAWMPFV